MRATALLLAIGLALVTLPGASAHAAPAGGLAAMQAGAPTTLWVEDAISGITRELALRERLDSFTPDPTATTVADWVLAGTTMTTNQATAELAAVEETNAQLLEEATGAEWALSDAVIAALRPAQVAEAAEVTGIEATPMLDALSDLIIRQGVAPTGDRTPGEHAVIEQLLTDFDNTGVVDLTQYRDFAAPAVPAGGATLVTEPAGGVGGLVPLLAAITTVLIAGIVFMAFRRRRRSITTAKDVATQTGLLPDRRRLQRDLSHLGDEEAIGIVMIDVDAFAEFVDRNGTDTGDLALDEVLAKIRSTVRNDDTVYHHGGPAFAVVFRDCDEEHAMVAVERIRSTIERLRVAGDEQQPFGSLTVSVGVAIGEGADAALLSERAGAALYGAKQAGANQVVRYGGDDDGGIESDKMEPAQ